jgi:hypothetical protein
MNKQEILIAINTMLNDLEITNNKVAFIESDNDLDKVIFQIKKDNGRFYEYEIFVTGGFEIKDK